MLPRRASPAVLHREGAASKLHSGGHWRQAIASCSEAKFVHGVGDAGGIERGKGVNNLIVARCVHGPSFGLDEDKVDVGAGAGGAGAEADACAGLSICS